MQLFSGHPVHIMSESNTLNPSAFIPFCAYDGDTRFLGRKNDNFSLPICSAFQPRLVSGQGCYTLDIHNITEGKDVKQGLTHGLTLFVDSNDERMVSGDEDTEHSVEQFRNLHEEINNDKVKIHIGTIEPYTGHGGGNYELSSLKSMATTQDFLSLPLSVRGCQRDYSTQQCHLQYYKQNTKQCGCQPFSLVELLHNDTVRHILCLGISAIIK